MTTATIAVELERFQLIPTGEGPALLRILARWRAEETVQLDPPVLVIDDGHVQRMFESLPGPRAQAPTASPDGPRWQAGFSVPDELLAGDVAFALDAGAAGIVGLPAPVPADSGVIQALPAQPVAAEQPAPVEELKRELAAAREEAAAAREEADVARQGLAGVMAQMQEAQRLQRAAEERAERAEAQLQELGDALRLAETRAAAAREARAAAEARALEAERALEAAAATQ